LNEINNLACEIYCSILNKINVPKMYFVDKNKLYNFVVENSRKPKNGG
jgi:hypothetical protein